MYHHTCESAADYAKKARFFMAKYAIPESPDHYEVWYAHVSGAYPDLSNAIAEAQRKGVAINVDLSRELRLRYLSDRGALAAVEDVNDGVQKELGRALEVLNNAGGDARQYGKILDRTVKALDKDGSPESAASLVRKMISETRDMVEKSASLENRLNQSSSEIEHLRARLKEATDAARTDILTQIANRRAFDEFLYKAMLKYEATGKDVTLILGDVDHFKKFNDTWGHQMGDQVLRLVAKSIEHHVPEGALAARYGGEEFAVVLPGQRMAEAAAIAEKIRAFVAAKSIKRKSTGETVGRITISFGVAQARTHDNETSLTARADEALYEAKRRGRNQVAQSFLKAAI